MRYAFIVEHRQEFPVGLMCRVLSVSKSGFYSWQWRGAHLVPPKRQRLQEAVKKLFEKKQKRYGSPRIWRHLMKQGTRVGKSSVEQAMRDLKLKARPKKRYKRTTDSDHTQPIAPNLLARNFVVADRNAVWVSDITYLPLYGGGFIYLCVVMDLASREIIGWHVDDNMRAQLICKALMNAVASQGSISPGIIFHSDQGSQYASDEFLMLLKLYKMQPSMSRRGQCWDNAPMESFFKSLKEEYEEALQFEDLEDGRSGLFDYIEIFYNRDRMHSGIGYQVPSCYMVPASSEETRV